MPIRLRVFFAILMVVLFFIPAVALFSELSNHPEIWRAPPAADRLPLLLFYAAMCGFEAALFLVIATGRLAYRGELPRE
jgi:hypothetical protein